MQTNHESKAAKFEPMSGIQQTLRNVEKRSCSTILFSSQYFEVFLLTLLPDLPDLLPVQ
jgi:hypothetical protein